MGFQTCKDILIRQSKPFNGEPYPYKKFDGPSLARFCIAFKHKSPSTVLHRQLRKFSEIYLSMQPTLCLTLGKTNHRVAAIEDPITRTAAIWVAREQRKIESNRCGAQLSTLLGGFSISHADPDLYAPLLNPLSSLSLQPSHEEIPPHPWNFTHYEQHELRGPIRYRDSVKNARKSRREHAPR